MDKTEKKHSYATVDQVILFFQTMIQFTLYHSVACLVTSLIQEENWRMYIRMGILLIPLFLFSFTRRYVGNLLVFALIHLGTCGLLVTFFPERVEEYVAVIVCLLVMVVNSVHFRLVESYKFKECPQLMMLAVLFIVYGLAAYQDRVLLETLCYYECVVYIFCYVISNNLENTERFIKLNEDTANFPVRQVKGVNRTLLSFFSVLLLGVMILAPRLHPEVLLKKIGNVLRGILRWIFSHFDFSENIDYEALEKSVESTPNGGMFMMEEGTPSAIALFLDYLLRIVVGVGLAALAVFAIGYGLYQIYKRFYGISPKGSEEHAEKGVRTVTESIPIFRRTRESEEESVGMNKKIRKQYRKSVKKREGKMEKVSTALTPSEIEEVLPEGQEGWSQERIALYEKARYSKAECTREELERMKKLV